MWNLFSFPMTRTPRLKSSKARPCRPGARVRPRLELLEDRTLPSGTPSVTLELIPGLGSSLPAVTLGLDSYQFGFKNATTIGPRGAASGATTFDDLKVSAPMSEASPQLFGVVAAGSHYSTAVLTQRDAAGEPMAEWVMGTVFISSDLIHNDSAAVPTEDLKLAFGSLTAVTSTHTASWDQINDISDGPAGPDGATLAALPPRVAPALTLELQPSSGQPAVTLGLDSFHFDMLNMATAINPDGLVDGKALFQDLEVSAPLSGVSPQLFGQLTAGGHFARAVVTQHDATGNAVAEWVLGNGLLTSDVIAGGAAAPTEALHLAFESMTEATSAHTASWDQISNTSNGPAGPNRATLAALPPRVAPALTLELQPGSGLPAITLGLDSYQFEFGNDRRNIVTGKFFQDVEVSAPLSGASPVLFFSLFAGGPYSSAVLTQRNAAGDPVAEWVMGGVSPTSDDITGGGNALPTEKLKLLFGSMTEVTLDHTASWNQFTNSTNGPAAPAGVTLAALPPFAAPAVTLEFPSAPGSSFPAVTLGLDTYKFGFVNQGPVGSRAFFSDLSVSGPLSGVSPQLFAALAADHHFGTAVLTQRNAAGDPVAEWVLGNVLLNFDFITSGGAAVPTEGLVLSCDTVTEVTSAQATSWNQVADGSGGPTAPQGVTLAALPTVTAPALTLELPGGSTLPAVTLALNSYKFGQIGRFNNSLDVLAPMTGASPQLSAALLTLHRYSSAVLTQRNAAGDPVAEWILGNTILTVDQFSGSGSAVPTEWVQLAFDAVTEVTSAHAGSWNLLTQNNLGPAAPNGVTLAALPAPTAPALTLELRPSSASTLPAVTLALDSYQLGTKNAPFFGSREAAAGKASLQVLTPSAPLNGASPQLFAALVAGRQYATAVLTQRNAAGDPVAEWVLGDATLFSLDNIAGSGPGVPTEGMQLNYDSVTEVTLDHTASWNQTTNTNSGPTPPAGVTLVPLGAVTPTLAITDNGGVYNGVAFGVSAATVRVGDTTLATLGASSLTFTYYAGSAASGTGSATAPIDAGTYTVVAHFSSINPRFYTDADSAAVVFIVTPAPLTVTANNLTKITGEANPTFTVSYTGFVPGQGPDVLAGTLTFSTPARAGSPSGAYVVTPVGLTSRNYAISFLGGTLTVLSAGQATNNLLAQVNASSIPSDIQGSLMSQLQAAIDSFNRGNTTPGVNQLSAFIQHVRVQKGRKIDAALADVLIATAQRIINAAG